MLEKMGTFIVTLRCVRCRKETKTIAEGDPAGEHDVTLPRGWQPVVHTASAEPIDVCDAICKACRSASQRPPPSAAR
jgi:hypothetical protein